jgi:MFS family permease
MGFAISKEGLAPLQHKEFKTYIASRFVYIMCLRMLGTVVAYKLFQLTQTSLAIGLVGLAEFIPVFALALYAGHVVDKTDKRTLLLRGMLLYGVCVAALIAITLPQTKNISVQLQQLFYYTIIFFTGVIRAFTGPATHAIIAQLVPKHQLPFAANISSSTWLIASITGHAGGGFLIAGIGVHGTFIFILICVLIAAFIISHVSKKPILQANKHTEALKSVKEGLQFVMSNKIMLGAMCLDLFAVLFGGAVALLPEFAQTILKVGPVGFGWLNAATDIGAITTIVFLTLYPMKKNQGKKMFFAVFGFGVCIIVFALSKSFVLSFIALLCSGICDGVSVLVRGTILQITTPDEMRGRVSAVNSMFINSSNELGMMESGLAARFMGLVPSVIFGGSVTILVVIITWFKAPSLKKMEY